MGVLLRGGTLVLKDMLVKADILIENGKIARIGTSIDSGYSKIIDVRGKMVIPGAIDPHIHGREPGLEYKDDFLHTTRAALLGGVTTVLDMPNTVPPVDTPARLAEKISHLQDKSYADFGLYAVLYDYGDDIEARIVELIKSGAVGFKVYMAPTTGGIRPPSFSSIYRALELSRKLGFVVALHAEDWGCVEFFTTKVMKEGGSGLRAYSNARPPLCEEISIDYIASIAKSSGGRAYIAHVSSAESLKIINRYRGFPAKLYAEVTPIHLFFDYEEHEKLGALVKVNPPIRSSKNRRRLWEALARGLVDVVATDHAPHADYEKKKEDFWSVAAGAASIQHSLSLMVSSALEGLVPLTRIVKVCSENPAKIFGLYPVKGSLLPGADADIVVIDPSVEHVVMEDELEYKYKLTPYINWRLRGRIDKVFLRGELVVDEGTLVVKKPPGKFIRWYPAGNLDY